MASKATIRRWVRLVVGAVAGTVALAAVSVLPATIGLLPQAIRGGPIEWSAVGLLAAFVAAHLFTRIRPVDDRWALRVRRALDQLDIASGQLLCRGFTVALLILAAALLASWVPHYLTWPWCRDEDTFATLAQSWNEGIRPFRDIRAFCFPGHLYLHWFLGRTFGWGRTVAFYAVDAAAVIALGVALWFWSRRRLGGPLPGMVAYVAFLGFYLSVDYQSVAERDWHAPLAAALALMALETLPGRLGLWIAAALAAAALSINPHPVLFLPAMAAALAERPRPWRSLIEWAIALGLFACLAFAPYMIQGLLDDWIRSLRVVLAPGGPYSKATPGRALEVLASELRRPWTIALFVSLVFLGLWGAELRRPARIWLLALIAAVFYRILHPLQHEYLELPLGLISSIVLALPVAWVVSAWRLARPVRVLAVAMIVYEAVPQVPTFCSPIDSIRAIGPLVRGAQPAAPPPGCRMRGFTTPSHYGWTDYCRVLDYLRRETRPETEIANFLRKPYYPSLNGPAGRLSPFRASSGICWMVLIDVDLDAEFAAALEGTPDSVVVWSPGEDPDPPRLKLDRVTAVIRRCYRPEARFGGIEVWRRSPEALPRTRAEPNSTRHAGAVSFQIGNDSQ
jgi:hypothetical protein